MDMVDISSWAGSESKPLTESARGVAREVLARNRLRERVVPRDEYLMMLNVVTYAVSEESDTKRRRRHRHEVASRRTRACIPS